MAFNPCTRKSIKEALPKIEDVEPTDLTVEEIPEVTQNEQHPMSRALLAVMLGCALRPPEAVATKWEDIENGQLSILRVRQQPEKQPRITEGRAKTRRVSHGGRTGRNHEAPKGVEGVRQDRRLRPRVRGRLGSAPVEAPIVFRLC